MTILIVILVIAAVVFFGLLYSLYNTAARNSDKMKERVVPLPQKKELDPYREEMKMLVEQMWDLPWETVQTRSKDGLTLSGRYLHVRDGAPVVIMAHGYRGSGLRDFCGGNKIARENGYNTLLIDNRAHGKSGGNTLTFGVKERYDILCWIDYVTGRFGRDTEIFLYGISMGASTVLMSSGLDLPANVKGVVADCPYSSPEAIVRHVIRLNKMPDNIFFPLVWMGIALFGGASLKAASCVEAVKKAKVPILLIHGTCDDFVPCEMSREISEACASEVQLELFEGAIHGVSYLTNELRYEKILLLFMERCLNKPVSGSGNAEKDRDFRQGF